MSKSFGKEIGLIHQIIVQSGKFGASDRTWKFLAEHIQPLIHMIDQASFFGASIEVQIQPRDGGHHYPVLLVCFAQTDWVGHEEIKARVKRFGRFASDEELTLLSEKLKNLWEEDTCPDLQYPIVSLDSPKTDQTEFLAITYGVKKGVPTLSKLPIDKQQRYDKSIYWAPGTHFAVVFNSSDSKCEELYVELDRTPIGRPMR